MDKARLILCFETIYLRILHIFRESSIREDNYLRIGVGRRAFCVFFVKRCIYRYSTFRSCLIKFQNCLTLKSKSPFQNLPRTLLAKLPLESFQKFPREDVFELVVGRIRQSWLTGIFWERSARSFSNLKDLNLDSFPCQAHELPKDSTLNHAHCSTAADFDIPSNFFLATFHFAMFQQTLLLLLLLLLRFRLIANRWERKFERFYKDFTRQKCFLRNFGKSSKGFYRWNSFEPKQ